jgi:hypothetical protein
MCNSSAACSVLLGAREDLLLKDLGVVNPEAPETLKLPDSEKSDTVGDGDDSSWYSENFWKSATSEGSNSS